MVTEIRQAMRETADGPSFDALALDAVVAAGARRVRHRRIVAAVGTAGLTVAVVLGAATLTNGDDRAEVPHPSGLRLEDAEPATLDVLHSRTAPWEVPDDTEDLAAVTADGKVIQGRGKLANGTFELGLLDPTDGTTEWLPAPPGPLSQLEQIDLGADRLVYLDWHGPRQQSILTYDRDGGTWTRAAIEVPQGDYGRFFGVFIPGLGPDGRVYLLDSDKGQHWWSVPMSGGPIRPEPSLDGTWATWSGSAVATGDYTQRIRLSRDGEQVAEIPGPPTKCSSELVIPGQAVPPNLRFAGTRLVAYFQCAEGNQVVVYDGVGKPELSIAPTKDLWVEAAGEHYVLLNDTHQIYLLDLDTGELSAIDRTEPRESAGAAIGAGLVLYDVAVWNPGRDAWDTVHKVARLP